MPCSDAQLMMCLATTNRLGTRLPPQGRRYPWKRARSTYIFTFLSTSTDSIPQSNILIDSDGSVKLTDVGMWRVYETLSSSYADLEYDNYLWNAPEILLPGDDDVGLAEPSSDVYAFACTCIEVRSHFVVVIARRTDIRSVVYSQCSLCARRVELQVAGCNHAREET